MPAAAGLDLRSSRRDAGSHPPKLGLWAWRSQERIRRDPSGWPLFNFLGKALPSHACAVCGQLKPLSLVDEWLLPKTKYREAAKREEKDQAGEGVNGTFLQGWQVETCLVNRKVNE